MSKKILITGATRGLGRAMTEEFIRLDHTVWGCGRSKKEIEELKRRFKRPNDFTVVDVSSDDQVGAWARRLLRGGKPPDLVLNNAGVINRNAPLWAVPAEEFSLVIDVNLKGTANVIRHFVPAMLKTKRGMVVNFSSGWGRSTAAEVAPYCATKWGIEGLSQAMAQDLGSQGVGVIALNPGVIDTDMLRSCFGGSAGGYLSPEQWAKTAVPFLLKLSPEQNGQALTAPE